MSRHALSENSKKLHYTLVRKELHFLLFYLARLVTAAPLPRQPWQLCPHRMIREGRVRLWFRCFLVSEVVPQMMIALYQ